MTIDYISKLHIEVHFISTSLATIVSLVRADSFVLIYISVQRKIVRSRSATAISIRLAKL